MSNMSISSSRNEAKRYKLSRAGQVTHQCSVHAAPSLFTSQSRLCLASVSTAPFPPRRAFVTTRPAVRMR